MLRKAIDWLESVARDVGTQLMHANHSGHLYSSIVARRLGVPSIWHVHDYPYNWDWIDILCRRVHSDHIIFTTNKVRSGYRGLSGRPNDVIRPIAVEPGRLKRVIPEPDIRARLKLGVGPILLTVARFQAHKGHADLLEAVPEIIRQRPDAQFVIVGQPGNDAEERYRRELLKQSEKLRLAEHVRFVGFVSENELVSLYREAFALVHPARTEGFGLAILEALAFSMPIVAAAADGPSALIDHGVTGLLVPPRSPRNLTTAVLSLLNDPQLAARLGKAGLQASSSYRSEVMVDETVAVYRSLLGGRCVTPDLSASPEANPV